MTTGLRIGALDFSRTAQGIGAVDALQNTIDLASHLDLLGYSRYWLAEHHVPNVAHSCPEILVSILAGLTERIRVGVAGILLRYYSPLKVANTFHLLATLYPGRIDLGIANGAIDNRLKAEMLLDGVEDVPARFEQKVSTLIGLMRGAGPVAATPSAVASPEVWLLGSGGHSATRAAELGTSFSLGLFIEHTRADAKLSITEYRDRFVASQDLATPQCSLAVAGVCAETEKEAQRIAADTKSGITATVVGTPSQCVEQLLEFQYRLAITEFVFLDLGWSLVDRLRSYSLLAEAAGLTARTASSEPVDS